MNTHPNGAIAGKPGIAGLGERLKCVREMRQISQRELATMIGFRERTGWMVLDSYETGARKPGAEILRSLCLALNCSADYLLDCAK